MKPTDKLKKIIDNLISIVKTWERTNDITSSTHAIDIDEFEGTIKPILSQIKNDRGITDYRVAISQTPEQMDAHEISATIYVKQTPTLDYVGIDFVATPHGISPC